MGKKVKKKKKPRNNIGAVSPEQLKQQAQHDMETGKFRRARDAFKRLAKQDPDLHAAGLLQAQCRLFHQLMDGGRRVEARQVLAALKRLDSGRAVCAARVRLAMSEGDFIQAANAAAEALSLGPSDMSSDDRTEDFRLADALVLAFEPGDSRTGLPPAMRAELNGIAAAFEHVAQGEFDGALERIKSIGLHSIFSNWKWFIKGLCAFYGRQDDKARLALGKILSGSAPAQAAEAYVALLNGENGAREAHESSQLVQGACLVAGHGAMGEAMARAQYLWEVGRFRDSFKHLRAHLTDFPTQRPGMGQALTAFYYTAFHEMEEGRAEKYLDFLVASATDDRRGTPLERFLAHRALALWMEGIPACDQELIAAWGDALGWFRALSDDVNRAGALVYSRLGDIFAAEEPDEEGFDFFFRRGRRKREVLRNAELAASCYRKAIEADPENRHGWFSLLSLYEKIRDKSKINNALDDIIKRFPEEKEAMFKAGIRCLERNAFLKGMKYLEQALELDPIDSRLREGFILACIQVALKHAQNGRMDKGREALEKAEVRASRTSDDFNRGLSYLYARWSVMEALAGEDDAARRRMEQALALCRNHLKLHYFTSLIGKMYGVPEDCPAESRRVADAALAGSPSPDAGVSLVTVLRYFHLFPLGKARWLDSEQLRINDYLMKAIGETCSREQAAAIIEYAMDRRVNALELARRYIGLMLGRNPEDARFRWFQLAVDLDLHFHTSGLRKVRGELAAVLELAHNQGDRDVAEHVERALKRVEQALKAHASINALLGMDLGMDFDDPGDPDDDLFDPCDAPEIDEIPSKKKRGKVQTPDPYWQPDLFDME